MIDRTATLSDFGSLVNVLRAGDSVPLFLAPLAGYTDQAFRTLCKLYGADFLVSEMVSADGLTRDSAKTIRYVLFQEIERPFGVQIFGSNPLVMAKAAEFLLDYKPDFIDINMGCPVKKVIQRGAGSALMQNPVIASAIVREVKRSVGERLPISVKFRSGWDNNNLNFLDFGKLMQDSGADIICLHPRTTKQMFSGLSNWEHIRELKASLSVPLIGNGDVKTPEDAKRMKQETNCDAVMIGRGALGKPWLFNQSKSLLNSGSYLPLERIALNNVIIKHLELATQFKPERVVVKEIRSHVCFYTKGLIGGAELRNKINHAESIAEIVQLLNGCLLS